MSRESQRINVAAALIIGADFAMMLAALTLVLPPTSYAWPVLAPHVAAVMVMVVFGPYLLAVSFCGILGALLSIAHLVLLCMLVRRVRAFNALGRWSRAARLLAVAFGALLMALSIWCEFPVVERHAFVSDKVKGETVRLAVISDLHSCAYGGQWLIPFLGRGGYSPDQHFFPKYVDGRYALANGSEMLVSRGLARESTPLPRLFNPPEIMVVELMGGI